MVASCNATSVPLYTAELFGTLIEAGFYGAMVPTAIRTLNKLERRRKEGNGHSMRIFQAITCSMMVVATWHFTVESYRIAYSSLHFEDSLSRTLWLADDRGLTQSLKDWPIAFQTLTGDGILLYRCYLLWPEHKWVAAWPTFTYLASWGFGLAGVGRESTRIETSVFNSILKTLILGFFISSTITVISSTCIILFKVWLTRRRLPGPRVKQGLVLFTPSLTILLESGLLYCSLVLVLLGLYVAQCAPFIIAYDMLAPVIPILFCSVLLSLSATKDKYESSRPSGGWSSSWNVSGSGNRNPNRSITTNPSVHMGVHIEREIELSPVDPDKLDTRKAYDLSRMHYQREGRPMA